MTPVEFAGRMVGKPWKKWRASWEAADCFGLIVLYFREVLGIELGEVPHTDIAAGFTQARGWQECAPEGGATCWMAWHDGAPTHCGILLDAQRVLHSEGSDDYPGSVRVSRLSAVQRIYGTVKFYRYEPPCP